MGTRGNRFVIRFGMTYYLPQQHSTSDRQVVDKLQPRESMHVVGRGGCGVGNSITEIVLFKGLYLIASSYCFSNP